MKTSDFFKIIKAGIPEKLPRKKLYDKLSNHAPSKKHNLSEDEKKSIENDLSSLKEALENDDIEAIKTKTEALSMSSMKLGEAIYQSEQAAAASGTGGEESSSGPAEDGVVDADFEEVKEEEKS